jgi:GMP synthase-like glutamine amidotransferase
LSPKVLLVIDPFLKVPAVNALNTILNSFNEVQKELQVCDTSINVIYPFHNEIKISEYLNKLLINKQNIIGVISLGSFLHIENGNELLEEFSKFLKKEIIEKSIPFLGICFSHQLFAYIYESKVGYINQNANEINVKYNELRKINVIHNDLIQILNGKNSFVSKAKYEQEVKSFNQKFLELTCFSEACKIEGLKHIHYPSFSFQTHPEETIHLEDNPNVIKLFITYFLRLSLNKNE